MCVLSLTLLLTFEPSAVSFIIFYCLFLAPLLFILSGWPYWAIFVKVNQRLAFTSLSLSFCMAHAPPLYSWHFLIWPCFSVFFYILSNSLFLWLLSCRLSCLSFLLQSTLPLCLSLVSSVKCAVWVSVSVFVFMFTCLCESEDVLKDKLPFVTKLMKILACFFLSRSLFFSALSPYLSFFPHITFILSVSLSLSTLQ